MTNDAKLLSWRRKSNPQPTDYKSVAAPRPACIPPKQGVNNAQQASSSVRKRDRGATHLKRYLRMFSCDSARIISPMGRLFLIIGWKRNTKDDPGQWYKNGEPIDFDYLKEETIASGDTEAELLKSARHYKKLLRATKEPHA